MIRGNMKAKLRQFLLCVFQLNAVVLQKQQENSDSDPFIPINKPMVLNQTAGNGCDFLQIIGICFHTVKSGVAPGKSALNQAQVPYAAASSCAFKHDFMQKKHFINFHFANS